MILIRAELVTLLGTEISSIPSLAVLPNIVTGNVSPPSVDNSIFTLVQLIGAPVVPDGSQVMVAKSFTCQVMPPALG